MCVLKQCIKILNVGKIRKKKINNNDTRGKYSKIHLHTRSSYDIHVK